MPVYEYRCGACGKEWAERLPSMSSPAPACPACGAARPEKVFSTFALGGRGEASGAPADGGCGHGGPCACGRF